MKTVENDNSFFSKQLFKWNKLHNKRQMPWKGEKDPYKIWLSEIILQQTRVEQGLGYYNRFVKKYPTVSHLSKAPEEEVFKLWEGLGYYSRCKNLISTAKYISLELKGEFPHEYEKILALKGIGPYTAAAIGSFAFNLPYAVVDGNVFRVLSRYFAIATPIDSVNGKKQFTDIANKLLDTKKPGIYNQALMDFGATICKPQLPLCSNCLLSACCKAYLKGAIDRFPVKEKSISKRKRWLYYFLAEYKGKLYIRKRDTKDIWENLYEFVLLETEDAISMEKLNHLPAMKKLFGKNKFEVLRVSKMYKQLLTHQTIQGQFVRIKMDKPLKLDGYTAVSGSEIELLPFPKFITAYLKDKNVSLNMF